MEPSPATKPSVEALPGLPDHEVLQELGRGGMGVVYLATNKVMGRNEVLKVVNPQMLSEPGFMDRFLQEIRSAAQLSHPNIVTAHAVLRSGESLVLAMEHIVGENLFKVVGERGPLPVPNACYYVHQVAMGLQHANDRGMVHRDIKPDNLMLAREGKKHVVKILDFGLAKATREKEDSQHNLTGAGKMMGTPDYIAPEQILDAAKADIRADIYSLGCTLYFLLTGTPPFQGGSLYEKLQAHMSKTATAVHELRNEVPPELSQIVAKMMAKDVKDRFQKPGDVAQALVPFVKGVKSLSGGDGKADAGGISTTLGGAAGKTKGDAFTLVPDETPHKTIEVTPKQTMVEAKALFIAPVVAVRPKLVAPASKPPMAKGTKLLLIGGGLSALAVMLLALCGTGLWLTGTFDRVLGKMKQAQEADRERKLQAEAAEREKKKQQQDAAREQAERAEKEKLQAAERDRQDRFQQALDGASKALDAKNTEAARKKLDIARAIQPFDVRIKSLEDRLKDVTDEAEFQKNVNAGDKALTSANLDLAAGSFDAAIKIRPNANAVQVPLAAVRRLLDAQGKLKLAKSALDQKDFTATCDNLRAIRESLFGVPRKQIENDKRFQLVLTQVTDDATGIHWKLAAEMRAVSKDRTIAGDGAVSKADYDQALTEFDLSIKELVKVKESLEVLNLFPGKTALEEVGQVLKATENDLKVVASKTLNARGLGYTQLGKNAMKQGNDSLALAKKKSAQLWNADAAFFDAVNKFKAAQSCLGMDADADLKAAIKARADVALLKQPLALDLKNPKILGTWSYSKLDWVLQSTGRASLRSGDSSDLTLSSPSVEFPADFELEVNVETVDKDGKPRTDQWSLIEDLFVLSLVPRNKNSPPATISIGKDPAIKTKAHPRIAIGSNPFGLPKYENSSLTIQLIRRQGRVTIKVGAKDIDNVSWGQDFHKCVIQVNNVRPPRTFIAVYSVSLRALPN